MKKGFFAIILCVAFSVLFAFSGCSNSEVSQRLSEDEYEVSQRLSEDEYIEGLEYNFKEYSKTISTLFSALEYGVTEFEAIDPDQYEQEYQKAKTALNNIAALTPPEEYSELDSKLKSGVSRELEYVESLNEYYSHIKNYPDLSENDLSEMGRIVEEIENIVSGDYIFAEAFSEIFTHYNSKTE